MSDALTSRSLSTVVVNAIHTVSRDMTLAYITTAGASVMCSPATSQAFLRDPSSLISKTTCIGAQPVLLNHLGVF